MLSAQGKVCLFFYGEAWKPELYFKKRTEIILNLSYPTIGKQKRGRRQVPQIYNVSFQDDCVKCGECPAYGRAGAGMEESAEKFSKLIIDCGDVPAGAISAASRESGAYCLECPCALPE